jgi:hypothetical protein
MNSALLALAVLLAGSGTGRAGTEPPFEDETLRYTVSWPSGLPLGEGLVQATKVETAEGAIDHWEFDMTLDAAVPGFRVTDRYRSLATPGLCSVEFEKESTHGKRKARERTTFDPGKGSATRQTLGGGGKSQFPISTCAQDALTFLFHVRRELSRGRVPPPQTILFGAPYEIRLEYRGRRSLRLGQEMIETDHVVASVKGKASDITFEVFFALDQARRPVMVRVPLPLGTFSMELVP